MEYIGDVVKDNKKAFPISQNAKKEKPRLDFSKFWKKNVYLFFYLFPLKFVLTLKEGVLNLDILKKH